MADTFVIQWQKSTDSFGWNDLSHVVGTIEDARRIMRESPKYTKDRRFCITRLIDLYQTSEPPPACRILFENGVDFRNQNDLTFEDTEEDE